MTNPGTRRGTDALRLVGLLIVEVAAVVALHRLGAVPGFEIDWSDLPKWLSTTTPEAAVGAVLRLVALVCAWWLLATTVLYALGRLAGLTRLVRAVEWATLPGVRRLADRVAAVTLAVATVAAPVAAVAVPPIIPVVREAPAPSADEALAPPFPMPPTPAASFPEETDRSLGPAPVPAHDVAYQPTPAGWQPPLGPLAKRGVLRVESSAPPRASLHQQPAEHTVQPGDNLWVIAEAHLERLTGRDDLSDGEIARYWVQVIEANRARIRSGDPDLIYPGEVILLPAVTPE